MPDLRVCPFCKQNTFILEDSSDHYRCLNSVCGKSIAKILIERDDQFLVEQKRQLAELDKKDTRSWFGTS